MITCLVEEISVLSSRIGIVCLSVSQYLLPSFCDLQNKYRSSKQIYSCIIVVHASHQLHSHGKIHSIDNIHSIG
jgi:late competence protein required for DNA uptake (superfamily II DNA/RNA helicase)